MLASSFRLDLKITVGPQKPGNIKTILSSSYPIFIEYKCLHEGITGNALRRMRVALRHRDRVRGISFEGSNAGFKKFFRETVCSFPVLDSLFLRFGYGFRQNIPVTFLRGPDLSDLHLRRLTLDCFYFSLAQVSGFLSSATALTDLTLQFDTATEPLTETSLLACLRDMHCLRNLDLTIIPDPFDSLLLDLVPKNTVPIPMSELTRFHYFGRSTFLNNLMARLSAPSLQDVRLCSTACYPFCTSLGLSMA